MPSRKKKQKTRLGEAGNPLSQSEIWDDSALIRSWNNALAEYDYYHSIHARGEDVEEILRQAEMGELDEEGSGEQQANGGWEPVENGADIPAAGIGLDGSDNVTSIAKAEADDDEEEDGEINEDEGPIEQDEQLLLDERRKAAMRRLENDRQPSSKMAVTAEPPPPLTSAPMIGPALPPGTETFNGVMRNGPATTPASPQDQTLENMKMAYYWAGYYSGLYDGQRQAHSQGPS